MIQEHASLLHDIKEKSERERDRQETDRQTENKKRDRDKNMDRKAENETIASLFQPVSVSAPLSVSVYLSLTIFFNSMHLDQSFVSKIVLDKLLSLSLSKRQRVIRNRERL